MIRAAIAGADTDAAGALIRILLNHPDVHLTAAVAPRMAGQRVDHHHYGVVGDTDLAFTSDADLGKIDVLFLAGPSQYDEIDIDEYPDLRIIDMLNGHRSDAKFVLGIPELNRKAMVRGARGARIPAQAVTLLATALLPLAKNLLLNSPIKVNGVFEQPADADVEDIRNALTALQTSFDAPISIEGSAYEDPRFAVADIELECPVDTDHLENIYRDFFDDHNLTHLLHRRPAPRDVRHTAKTLIWLQGGGEVTTVTVAHDPLRRAEAAAAVHCFNLLFGLHERTAIAPPV